MRTIYNKEISVFFSTITGPLVIILFLILNSLLLWSKISDFNILESSYASMDTFFTFSPLLFLFFIPSISMHTIANEYSSGTIEVLLTKPIAVSKIIYGKYLAVLTIATISLIPTLIYVSTIFLLGEVKGNLDLAGITGSYIGLLMLSSILASIGVFSSTLFNNQVNSLIFSIIISSFFYFGFDYLSTIEVLQPINLTLKKIGISYHYDSLSKGLLILSDIIYFLSITYIFLKLSTFIIIDRK